MEAPWSRYQRGGQLLKSPKGSAPSASPGRGPIEGGAAPTLPLLPVPDDPQIATWASNLLQGLDETDSLIGVLDFRLEPITRFEDAAEALPDVPNLVPVAAFLYDLTTKVRHINMRLYGLAGRLEL